MAIHVVPGHHRGPPASSADAGPGDPGARRDVKLTVEDLGNFSGNVYFAPADENHWSKVVWDPQAIRTNTAWMRLCNSDAWGDTCTEWREFKR